MLTYPAHVLNELAFDAVIKKGNKGLKVRRVQEWLSIHDCPTPVDGDFGDATEKCVKDFQQSKGMPTTGKVNKETWDALTAPLSDALKPVEVPEGSSLAEVNLRVVRQHLAQQPVEIGGENRGPWVRVYMGGNQGKEWRWCAGFVTFVMKQACMLLNRATPITEKRNGKVVRRETRVVSTDQKQMTVTLVLRNQKGSVIKNLSVYEKK